ncbi:hypothetical protein Q5752_001499 [Cryptotrichosporon argae]
MAWRCSGETNDELIDNLLQNGIIHSHVVADAMKQIDRAHYVPDRGAAYGDSPQRIGFNATISAPHMHAHAAEHLLPFLRAADVAGGAVLDVGSGSGYLTAVFHRLAPAATVVGIDHVQGLIDLSVRNLRADGVDVAQSAGTRVAASPASSASSAGKVVMVCGDGRQGAPAHAPFTAIHVGAAAPAVPAPLVEQLARPGRMFIPVGEGRQDIWVVDKDAHGQVTKQKLFGVMYVPLTDRQKQWSTP